MTQIVIFKAGENISKNSEEPLLMTKENALAIINDFQTHGVDVPVDYEHAEASLSTEPKPAAGWIKSLAWSDEVGLIGLVEWTSHAEQMIKAGEYKYYSPYFFVNDENEITGLINVGLVNRPAFEKVQPLAAKNKQNNKPVLTQKIIQASKKDKGKNSKKYVLEQMEINMENKDIAKDNTSVVENTEVVEETPVEVKDETPVETTLTVDDLLNKLANIFGLKDFKIDDVLTAATNMVAKSVDTTSVVAIDIYNALVKEKEELKTKIDEILAKEQTAKADSIIEKYVLSGKLNKNDTNQVNWAKSFIAKDAAGFELIMTHAPKIVPDDGSLVDKNKSNSPRWNQIIQLAKEYDNSPSKNCTKKAWINFGLREKDSKVAILSDAELKELNL